MENNKKVKNLHILKNLKVWKIIKSKNLYKLITYIIFKLQIFLI